MKVVTPYGKQDLPVADLAELRSRVLPVVSLIILALGAIGAWWYLPGMVFRWRQCFLFTTIAAVGLTAMLIRHQQILSCLVLVLGGYALAYLAALIIPWPVAMMALELSIVAAASSAVPWAPVAASVGAVGLQYLLNHLGLAETPWVTPSLMYLVTGLMLATIMDASHQTLRWSWERHVEARDLAEQLRDRQGELNRTVKALDLAYRLLQRTNHELAMAREEAEEARHLKEQFAANISHELRTPLNLILGFSEMMYMSPHVYGEVNWTEPLRRDVAQLYSSSNHLSQLVDDVLDLSRLNAERMPLRRELADLSQVIEEAIATVRDLVRERPLIIQARIDPDIPRLFIDPTRIRQVILNLLNNAIRFTDRGQITLSLTRQEKEIVLSVTDTGVGIPEDELEAIFDEFYQSRAAPGEAGGMGLGLAISKRFVRMHNGRIWAESTVGEGSTFYVSLPLDTENQKRTSHLRLSQPLTLPKNPYENSVILYDEGNDVARLLERHLDECRVFTASTPEAVYELVAEHHPKAVIRNLPLESMRSLLADLAPRDIPHHMPVLFASLPSNKWRAEVLQVQGSLQKPVRREDLLPVLQGIGPLKDILIVDDDRGFVQMLVRLLSSTSDAYFTRWAYDGVEGLAEMRRKRPDVVILDLLMPGYDGRKVLASMRGEAGLSDIPVIVVTASDVEEDLAGVQVGIVGLAQREAWSIGDTLASMAAVLSRAKPSYVSSDAETPEHAIMPPA